MTDSTTPNASAGPVADTPSAVTSARPAIVYPAEARRELEALARRILIVGLDGATFDVLDPLMEDG